MTEQSAVNRHRANRAVWFSTSPESSLRRQVPAGTERVVPRGTAVWITDSAFSQAKIKESDPRHLLHDRVNLTDQSGQTGAVWYWYTGQVWPETGSNRLNSNLNSKTAGQPVRNGLPVGLTGLPAGLAGLPVDLIGNRPNSKIFWFKFKCPQSILNKYLYNIF